MSDSNIPDAKIETRKPRSYSKLWWLTGLCLLLAIGLIGGRYFFQGPIIHIQFQDGYGLKVGDTLRHRGIDIGEVVEVRLAEDLKSVTTVVQLHPENRDVAVEGSQFWIQRAKLRIGQVSGLDTVLGAKYLGVIPGPAGSTHQNQFVGVETPLGMTEGSWIAIQIRFSEGNGIQIGDPIRFRGIDVGEVVAVDLDPAMKSVRVEAHLIGQATRFAIQGTQFWIERPRLDLTEVRGLDTLVAGRYVAVEPSKQLENSDAADQSQTQVFAVQQTFEFVGLDQPPLRPWQPGSLEIVLECSDRHGIVVGAPVMYRGLEVGEVTKVRLAKDAASLLITCIVMPDAAKLVRANSVWWLDNGLSINAGLSGFQLDVPSVSALIRGGVSFATPTEPGAPVATGARFPVVEKAQPEWSDWKPRLLLEEDIASPQGLLESQQATRVIATWKSGITGLFRTRSAESWGIMVNGPSLLVTQTFWKEIKNQGAGVELEFAGQRIAVDDLETKSGGELVALSLRQGSFFDSSDPNLQELPRLGTTMPLLLQINNPNLTTPIAIESSRLKQDGKGWILDSTITLDSALEGSPVVDTSQKTVGILSRIEGQWWVVGWAETEN